MDNHDDIYGISMEYLWNIYGISMILWSGWWYGWALPLWKIWVKVNCDDDIPNFCGKIKVMFQTTNQP